jgi:hypothetical protein
LKQRTLTVNKPWVKVNQPIIFPERVFVRTLVSHDAVTVPLNASSLMSRSRCCGVCSVPSDSGDKFCGWCGNSLASL